MLEDYTHFYWIQQQCWKNESNFMSLWDLENDDEHEND